MSKLALMAGCLVLGGLGGFAASYLADSDESGAAPASSASRATPDVAVEVARLERRLDAIAAAAKSRNPGARAAPVASAGSPEEFAAAESPSDTGDPLAARVDSLEGRVAALERGGGVVGPVVPADLGAVASKELDALARALVQNKRYADGRKVLEHLLARGDLDEEQRTEMEMQLGYALRGAGLYAESEARFLETLRRVGENSPQGAWAGFQVAWDRYYQKDLVGASARMERSAAVPGVSPIVRVHCIYNAAYFAKESGDNARARTFLERLLNEHAKDIPASQANMKTQAEAWLTEIRGF